VLEFPLPTSSSFTSFFRDEAVSFFVIGSIHQQAQAIDFNRSCISGITGCCHFQMHFSFTSELLRS
jgi:hypothetical protein